MFINAILAGAGESKNMPHFAVHIDSQNYFNVNIYQAIVHNKKKNK